MAGSASVPTRAGRYVTQPSGYRAFMPAPLPPEPALDLSGDLQGQMSAADRALGRLTVRCRPDQPGCASPCSAQEAVLSSQIEGRRARCRTCLLPRRSLRSRAASRRGGGRQRRARDEPRARATRRAARLGAPDPRDPHRAACKASVGAGCSRANCATARTGSARRAARSQTASFVLPPPHQVDRGADRSGAVPPRGRRATSARRRSGSPTRSSRRSTRSSTAMGASVGCSSRSCSRSAACCTSRSSTCRTTSSRTGRSTTSAFRPCESKANGGMDLVLPPALSMRSKPPSRPVAT